MTLAEERNNEKHIPDNLHLISKTWTIDGKVNEFGFH